VQEWGKRAAIVGLVSTLGLAACSATARTDTTGVVSTTAAAPPPTSFPASSTTGAVVEDLVVIGDSFVAWANWPQMLADGLGEERGHEVALDDSLAAPGPLAPDAPALLRSDESAIARVAGADILVLQPQPSMAPAAMASFMSRTCGGPSNTECLEAGVARMRAYVDEYLDLALALVPDHAEVVVVLVGGWPVDALYADLRATDPSGHATLVGFVFDLMREVEASAVERGVAVVDIGAIFNGPSYGDVTDAGLLVEDGLHLSEAGSRVVADEVLMVLAAG